MGRVLLTVIRLTRGRGTGMYRWTAYNAVYPNGGITQKFLGCVWMNIEVQAAAMRRGGGSW